MIIGITGLPGSGKTYMLACRIGLTKIKQGIPVYANFSLEGAIRYNDLSEVYNVVNGVILIDEINLLCPSRFWQSFPPELLYMWAQSRKNGLDIYWTSQSEKRADVVIREVTNYVWVCSRLYPSMRDNTEVKKTMFPFEFFRASLFVPEEVGLIRRTALETHFFFLNKKLASKYNTYEPVKVAEHLKRFSKSSSVFYQTL